MPNHELGNMWAGVPGITFPNGRPLGAVDAASAVLEFTRQGQSAAAETLTTAASQIQIDDAVAWSFTVDPVNIPGVKLPGEWVALFTVTDTAGNKHSPLAFQITVPKR